MISTVLLDIINKYYIKPVSDGIRCKLPHSLQSLSDFEIFTQYCEVSKITDLEVAKMVIKRLLDKLA